MRNLFNIVNENYMCRMEQNAHDNVLCIVHAAPTFHSEIIHCEIHETRSQAIASIEAFCRYNDEQAMLIESATVRYIFDCWIEYKHTATGESLLAATVHNA